jgi:ABC-type molybdenum transport system ATPase subunit/photorepair protein PhrA
LGDNGAGKSAEIEILSADQKDASSEKPRRRPGKIISPVWRTGLD